VATDRMYEEAYRTVLEMAGGDVETVARVAIRQLVVQNHKPRGRPKKSHTGMLVPSLSVTSNTQHNKKQPGRKSPIVGGSIKHGWAELGVVIKETRGISNAKAAEYITERLIEYNIISPTIDTTKFQHNLSKRISDADPKRKLHGTKSR